MSGPRPVCERHPWERWELPEGGCASCRYLENLARAAVEHFERTCPPPAPEEEP